MLDKLSQLAFACSLFPLLSTSASEVIDRLKAEGFLKDGPSPSSGLTAPPTFRYIKRFFSECGKKPAEVDGLRWQSQFVLKKECRRVPAGDARCEGMKKYRDHVCINAVHDMIRDFLRRSPLGFEYRKPSFGNGSVLHVGGAKPPHKVKGRLVVDKTAVSGVKRQIDGYLKLGLPVPALVSIPGRKKATNHWLVIFPSCGKDGNYYYYDPGVVSKKDAVGVFRFDEKRGNFISLRGHKKPYELYGIALYRKKDDEKRVCERSGSSLGS